jgi:hypothetical protein
LGGQQEQQHSQDKNKTIIKIVAMHHYLISLPIEVRIIVPLNNIPSIFPASILTNLNTLMIKNKNCLP